MQSEVLGIKQQQQFWQTPLSNVLNHPQQQKDLQIFDAAHPVPDSHSPIFGELNLVHRWRGNQLQPKLGFQTHDSVVMLRGGFVIQQSHWLFLAVLANVLCKCSFSTLVMTDCLAGGSGAEKGIKD